jgi:hypothetical protein
LRDEGREYVVGRGPQCDLVLEDREVSREHVRLIRSGYTVFIKDLGSTRGSWLGRSSVYTGSTTEWLRPRMLRLGATVLSLELPDAVRKIAPPPLASAPMTPEPRSRGQGHGPMALSPPPPVATATPLPPPPSSAAAALPGRIHAYSYDPTPPPAPVPAVSPLPPLPPSPPLPTLPSTPVPSDAPSSALVLGAGTPKRAGWKRSGPIIGRGSGLLLLALAALAVLGALFVVFSLLE